MKTILSTWKRAIYIGPPSHYRLHLSYGMTGYYDPSHEWFMPDGSEDAYQCRPHFLYFTKY
jgi:hypothetical protein